MMHVVVFGGTGFLGRRVAGQLAEKGCQVRIAARNPGKSNGKTSEFVRADVRDSGQVARALAGAHAAVNCVSLYVETSRTSFHDVHVAGARNLAAAAAQADLKALVHLSGIGSDAGSASDYVRARGEGEQAVREAFPGAAILRPSVMFGPGDAFLNAIAGIAARTPVIPLFGTGETRLQPVFVEDVAKAAANAATSGQGGLFELGGPDILSYRAIVEKVLGWTGRRRLLVPVPMEAWGAIAAIAERLPSAPITPAQVALMRRDNIAGSGKAGFAELGIAPQSMDTVAPGYLAAGH